MLCIAFLVVAAINHTSERLGGDYFNVSANTSAVFETGLVGFPVAEHFKFAADIISGCGSNSALAATLQTSFQHKMKFIFELGALRRNELCF